MRDCNRASCDHTNPFRAPEGAAASTDPATETSIPQNSPLQDVCAAAGLPTDRDSSENLSVPQERHTSRNRTHSL